MILRGSFCSALKLLVRQHLLLNFGLATSATIFRLLAQGTLNNAMSQSHKAVLCAQSPIQEQRQVLLEQGRKIIFRRP